MISEVTFVPPNDVIAVFEEFCDEMRNTYNADVDKILDYIKDSYIGRYWRNTSRKPPLFVTEIWNMFYRTHQEMTPANNHIEGWHC